MEVFATESDAKARSECIQRVLKSTGPAFGTEWHHLDGPILLRVSGVLNPSTNDLSAAAFAS